VMWCRIWLNTTYNLGIYLSPCVTARKALTVSGWHTVPQQLR
jgi:hypothetical protein